MPLLARDARLVELTLISGELGEGVLQECAPVVRRNLCGGDIEVEGAGDAREGRGACYFHICSCVALVVLFLFFILSV